MNRREFLGAVGGSFALSMATPHLGTTAHEHYASRTFHETASERLAKILRYVPDTEHYRRLVQNAEWMDLRKQLDAFGMLENPGDITARAIQTPFAAISRHGIGPISSTELDQSLFFPALTVDQGIAMRGIGDAEYLRIVMGPDAQALASLLRSKGFEENHFRGGVAFSHHDHNLSERIGTNYNQYVCVLDDNVLVYAGSEQAQTSYVTWFEQRSPSLADGDILEVLTQQLPPDTSFMQWFDGQVWEIDWEAERDKWVKQLGYSQGDATKIVQTLKDPFDVQERLFGSMPPILSFRIGHDAGHIWLGPLESDPHLWLATGYEEPGAFVQVMFSSNEEALRAADIIEWRWENSPSWSTPGTYFADTHIMSPIHRFGIAGGVLIQKPVTHSFPVHEMIIKRDPAIYGWWRS